MSFRGTNLRTRGATESTEIDYLPSSLEDEAAATLRWSNLIAGWHLDEFSDGVSPVVRADVLGNYDFADAATKPSAAGIIGLGVENTDPGQLIASPPGVTGALTVNFWINRTGSLAGIFLVGQDAGATTARAFVVASLDGASISAILYSGSTPFSMGSSGLTAPLDTFIMVTLVKPAGTGVATLYRNDDDESISTASMPQVNEATSVFTIGQTGGNTLCVIDECYYFSDEKDAAWRADMYNAGAGRAYPN